MNSYTMASVAVKLPTIEAAQRAQAIFDHLRNWPDFDPTTSPNDLIDEELKEAYVSFCSLGIASLEFKHLANVAEECVGFSLDVENDSIILYDEEYCHIEAVVEFIKLLHVLYEIEPTLIQWASTCSRPIPSCFSGGAVVVGRGWLEWRESDDAFFARVCKEHADCVQ